MVKLDCNKKERIRPLFPYNYDNIKRSSLGLSNSPNLNAKIKLELYRNGEGKAFASISTGKISGRLAKKRKPPVRKGPLVCSQLSSKAKRCFRICANHYQKLSLTPGNNYPGHSTFIFLGYRNIIPSTDAEAKNNLNTFFQRIRRERGNIHYCWVAELQERGVIHFHVLTPERFCKLWLNRAWNEVVMNSCLKQGKISIAEHRKWLNELEENESYNTRLDRYKSGNTSRQPKKPSKSEFLLLPNITAVYKAANYMAKYISKEAGNIKGNLWNASTLSRKELKPIITTRVFKNKIDIDYFILALSKHLTEKNKFHFRGVCFNGHPTIWTPSGEEMMARYYEIVDNITNRKELEFIKKSNVLTRLQIKVN